ncbi:hypothetical protein BDK63_001891 [Halomonas campaniensis]|uniref:YjbF family lipoprotein n=1 Tax=Halomonas campaniensis TaxID=213554 RepID=A0A7W5PAW2_9GAMM|nr:YjbF family lipoprotein [Halomonas campaniensis]MBB3331012.1 hypothetical protein [Halomonas campaniensis]
MPPDVSLTAVRKSRPRAALSRLRRAASLVALPLLLAGCASGGPSLLGDALQGLLPGDDPAAERAAAIPFASLALDAGDRRGLVVMGAQAGDTTLWPTGSGGLITLHREGLQATAGLPRDLLDTRYRPLEGDAPAAGHVPWHEATPGEFRLERNWQEADGTVVRLSARGRLACRAPEPRELPLASLALQRCEQRLTWDDGRVTTGTLWREAESRRLWAVAETPWPGGPRIEWEVARPWW